jgi:hypothetical protein
MQEKVAQLMRFILISILIMRRMIKGFLNLHFECYNQ